MDLQDFSVKESIDNLSGRIAQADHWFWEYIHTAGDYADPSWEIELCFIQLQAIAEALGLEQFRKMIEVEYSDRKSSKRGLLENGITPDGDPYSMKGTWGQVLFFAVTQETRPDPYYLPVGVS